MVDTYFDISAILPAIEQQQVVLTANNRLRNHMLRAYAKHQRDLPSHSLNSSPSNPVWNSPRIFSLQQWFEHLWQQLIRRAHPDAGYMIASPAQQQLLWETIIQQSSLAEGLLQHEALAQAADSALRHIQLWQLDDDAIRAADPMMSPHSNSYCFLHWLDEFRARLSAQGFITVERAYAIVISAFRTGALEQEPMIWLHGFDDIPPLHQDLINSACEQLKTNTPDINYQVHLQRTECPNIEQEIRAAALWSKQQLEQQPNAMIGIIVPNLGQCRAQVERLFTEVFEPLAALPSVKRHTLPFNFSAGTPLASTPIIAAALSLLELHKPSWNLEAICALLHSPFFGDVFCNESTGNDGNPEWIFRTLLIERLRKQGKLQVTLADLRYHSQQLTKKLWQTDEPSINHSLTEGQLTDSPLTDSTTPPSLHNRFLHLENYRRASYGQKSAATWADFFQQQLTLLGWPGTRRLDSQEHQQLVLWQQVNEHFVQLDNLGITFSYTQALQHLRNLAGKTPFQPQTPHSPIQILGALEGAGLQFSHCWVMGLHHRQWPPIPSANPLLPIALQRRYNMPHASAERELVFAQALTQHYRHCAPKVVFSSPQHDQESELNPSALIRALPLTPLEQLIGNLQSASDENQMQLNTSKQFELIDSAQAPEHVDNEPVRGGAALFKEQAACPFNAFARLRLGAIESDAPMPGFSPIERGNMLHEALAIIWRQLHSQAELLALGDDELTDVISQSVRTAVDHVKKWRGATLGAFYCELESERLCRLLGEWLAQERERPAFRVIAIEQTLHIQFQGLPLTLRIDRIDQLENGECLLIDYKTGQPSLKSWQGERPDEPQLPLYAATTQGDIAAIAFAQINSKAMKWLGTGALSIDHPGIANTAWHDQLTQWQQVLTHLAQDFIHGDARVDFKNQQAQDYALELIPLNRIYEADDLAHYIAQQYAQQHAQQYVQQHTQHDVQQRAPRQEHEGE